MIDEPLTIDLSQSNQPKWIWDKKGFLQTDIQVKNLKDVQTLFFEQNNIYDFKSKIEVLTNFYTRLGMRDSLGKSISIMKWGEEGYETLLVIGILIVLLNGLMIR